MAKRDDIFPSKYLKASDLLGKPFTATIVSAPTEKMKTPDGKEEAKTVLYFRGAKKVLPLNRTNWDSRRRLWRGYRHVAGLPGRAYPATTEMRGEIVACIRVRAPAQGDIAAAPAKAASATKRPVQSPPPDDMADDIPF